MQVTNTIFDDVFRSISQKMPYLLIPLINEVFGTNYPENEKNEQLRNEHYEKSGKIITDSILQIRNHIYHIECQSKKDKTMSVRMFLYDVSIALENVHPGEDGIDELDFPESFVLYIRNHRKLEKDHLLRIKFLNNQNIIYECKVVKIQDYTIDDIFKKKLLFFLPYYILRYEAFLKSKKENRRKIEQLLEDYKKISLELDKIADETEKGSLYVDMINLIDKIADYIIPQESPYKEGIGDVMGGKILKLKSEELYEAGEKKANRKTALNMFLEGFSLDMIKFRTQTLYRR